MKTALDDFIKRVQADAEQRTLNRPELVRYEYGDGSGSRGFLILPRDEMPRRFNVTYFGYGDGKADKDIKVK